MSRGLGSGCQGWDCEGPGLSDIVGAGDDSLPMEVCKLVQQSVSSVPTKRVFSEELKVDAVRLVTGEGYSIAAAKSVGVAQQSLQKWHARLAPECSVSKLRGLMW